MAVNKPTRRQPSGFTLLELLVAITLMAIISGALYGALYVAFKAQRTAENALKPTRSATLALELLERDFAAALPLGMLVGSFQGQSGTGTGGTDVLTFGSGANVPRENETGCDIRQITLSIESLPDDPQPVLLRSVTSNLLASADPVVRKEVLCRGVKSFALRYFDGTTWQATWDSSGVGVSLPLAVEVALEFTLDSPAQNAVKQSYKITRVYSIPCGRSTGS